MNILMIDTATAACSVALAVDVEPCSYFKDKRGGELTPVLENFCLAPRRHADILLDKIEHILADAKLQASAIDCIAFTTGSGSFIGVRTAAAVAQGIAFVHSIPVITVPTLQLLAQYAYQQAASEHVVAMWDARMHEVYCGIYSVNANGVMVADLADHLLPIDKVSQSEASLYLQRNTPSYVGIGNGWTIYPDCFASLTLASIDTQTYPHASYMLPYVMQSLLHDQPLSALSAAFPDYLRRSVVQQSK